ncbi:MAG: CAP domain-containing protein [Burkholderiaceae bacterium]|nr:CAP domain-containing protein [Burkholderiaceae bacterium]
MSQIAIRRSVIGHLAVIAAASLLAACGSGGSDTPTTNQAVTATASVDLDRILQLVNAARAQARACGGTNMPATSAVTWNSKVATAAQVQSDFMRTQDVFTHSGAGGSNVGDRLSATGYDWAAVGENIAAGQLSEDEVVAAWLASPAHCSAIMTSGYSQIGVARANGVSTNTFPSYWTMVLARPTTG